MADFMVHRVRFFDYQPKTIQSLAADDALKKLAISRSDNTIEIWCLKNEHLESVILPALDRQVEAVLWCSSQLLSAGLDGFIILYDLAKLSPKKSVSSIGGAIWCMSKNKSETKIAIGTEDGYVSLYEVNLDGIEFVKSFNKQDSRILSIAWHKDEDVIVTGGIDNIRVWDVKSGQVSQRISLGRLERNKETLVWCLAITSNYTIISGDSRGKTCVWNAEQACLIKSFQTHAVDVLCLAIDESEEHVYCSGIDPTIVQLDYVTVNEEENYKTWVKSNVYYNHTHDVRAIIIANNQLISAGIDTKIVFKALNKQTKSTTRKYQTLPYKPVVDIVDDFILMQYDKYLEVWRLGQSSLNSNAASDLTAYANGDCLPVVNGPQKYLTLKSKDNHYIGCSSIGYINNSIWLAYSDINNIHVYRLNINSKQLLKPELKIEKVKSLPLACIKPAVCMKFIHETQRLCYITNRSCLMCLKLIDNDEFLLESCIQCVQDITLTDNRVYLMECKGDYVATADTDLNIIVWNLKTQKQVCALPRYEFMCTCMCFDEKNFNLFVCYSNRKIVEYNYENDEYTEWSREIHDKLPKEWFKSNLKFRNCFYDSSNINNIILCDEQYFILINKLDKMPKFDEKIFSKINKHDNKNALHISNKYRYIIYANEIKNHQLMLVEQTPLSISEKLPPSLKQKKFGT